jgi:ribosome-associated protein
MNLETIEFTTLLVDAIFDKKGSNILLLDVHGHSAFTDWFLIATGENERQLKAIADHVLDEARTHAGEKSRKIEGREEDGWLLLDFDHVVVHIFSPEQRAWYNLEELWSAGRVALRME